MEYKESVILYHGSRGGIVGDIEPSSRERCDFGKGFYMGTNQDQAKTLVAFDQAPVFYRVKLNIDNIPGQNILELKDMEWAYFVLYNRGKLNRTKGSDFYNHFRDLGKGKDLIVGPIADDAMNESMSRFINGTITDKAFLECIRSLDYGVQYVAKTPTACKNIEILAERELYGKELQDAITLSTEARHKGHSLANEIHKKFRREGRYLDEVLEEARNGHEEIFR